MRERPRPDFDAPGLRFGSVLAFPAVTATQSYDSNIFATERNETGDFITVLSPEFLVRSTREGAGWRARLGSHLGFHARETDENYRDLSAAFAGNAEVIPGGTLLLDTGYRRLHEERSSPDDVGGQEPTVFHVALAEGAYRQRFNRLTTHTALSLRHYRYEDTATPNGMTDNGDRDRLDSEQSLRVSYDLLPGYQGFVRGRLLQRNYDRARDGAGFDRDSDGYRIEGGIAVDLTGLLALELGAGYLSRSFDDRRLSAIDSMAAEASAMWNVTRLTTLTATLNRAIEETTVTGASARLDSAGSLKVDHELRRHVVLSGRLGYLRSDFEGASRKDNRYDLGLSVDYLLGRGLALSASATHATRYSDAADADFTTTVAMLRLRYGL